VSTQSQLEFENSYEFNKKLSGKEFFLNNRSIIGLFGALVILMIYFGMTAPNFFTFSNFVDVLRQMSMIAIISIGMTFVIVTGEIDLSVGSLVAASSAVLGYLTIKAGMNIGLAMLITLVLGAFSGYVVAFLRNKYAVPSFITTLGWLSVWRGVSYLITGGFPLSPFPASFAYLGSGFIGPIPVSVVLMIVLFIVFYYVLNKTPFGRYVFATGSNLKAAQLSGIPIVKVKTAVFIITGVLASFSGIILSSRLMSATPTVANGWELDVIAAVIVGGTSLFGGKGSLIGTFLGAIFIAILGNGMVLLGVSPYMQLVIKGAIIVLAVLLNSIQTLGLKGQQKDIS
jgi:ribose/xylose/arabinose/galactoside ABC-type transport system permease subunit